MSVIQCKRKQMFSQSEFLVITNASIVQKTITFVRMEKKSAVNLDSHKKGKRICLTLQNYMYIIYYSILYQDL